MKLATIVLMGIMLLGCPVALSAGDPAGASQVAIGFMGGSTWTSSSTGICIWYFPVVGNLDLGSLFVTDSSGKPIVDRADSYLIWVSDFSVDVLVASASVGGSGPLFRALGPTGKATIYFSSDPESRDWSNLSDRRTWGTPVAVFTRELSLVRSDDDLATDTFIFSAKLVSSQTFSLNGKRFNFRDLIPHGMTCFEYGKTFTTVESGTCVAIGGGLFGL
jgi:hypothetical protein